MYNFDTEGDWGSIMSSFGDRLREVRTNRDLTQDEVVSRLDVTRSVIARYESNTNDPPSENL